MVENVFDIGIGTGVDNSGLEKGLSEAERKVLKSAAEQSAAIEEAAQKQVEAVRVAEAEKIAEIKKSIEEQIQLEKSKGLDPSVMQANIDAIKQTEKLKINEIKTSSNLEVQIIQDAAKKKQKAVQDNAKKQVDVVRNGNKQSLKSIKDFAKSATQSLTGINFSKMLVPTAIAGAAVAGLAKLKGALDEAAAAYRNQEQAERLLQNAAKNNPYLNENNVKQLTNFANEMQRITGLDSDMIMQTQTRLASLNRNQKQIQDILKVAADMAATGVMSFDQAVDELNNTLNGTVKASGKLYPELRNLSKEALASGEAIELIGKRVAGGAEAFMQTGAGSVTAYKNALGDLKKIWGQDWEKATRGFRDSITGFINRIVSARREADALREAIEKYSGEYVLYVEPGVAHQDFIKEMTDRFTKASELGVVKFDERMNQALGNALSRMNELSAAITANDKDRAAMLARDVRTLADILDTEMIRVNELIDNEVSAAEHLINYHKALKTTNAEILKDAYLKNEISKEEYDRLSKINEESSDYTAMIKADIKNIDLKNQLLDAQMAAYKGLISNAAGVLTQEVSIEEAIKAANRELRNFKDSDTREERLKKIRDLQKKILDEALKFVDLKDEEELQKKLDDISKTHVIKRAEEEYKLRKEKRNSEYEEEKTLLDQSLANKLITHEQYLKDKAQLEKNFNDQEYFLKQEHEERLKELLKQRNQQMVDDAKMYFDAIGQIAQGISSIWTNVIDYQTNEKLRQNKLMIQSDEERAAEEEKILIEATRNRYKADLALWAMNVTMATANMALAVLNAMAREGTAAAIMAGIMGAVQVGVVASAIPKRPTFHSGGVVKGRSGQEVSATLLAGEKVTTDRQFDNIMQAFANMANSRSVGSPELNVKVINNASNEVNTTQSLSTEGLELVINKIVDKQLSSGRLDNALNRQKTNSLGASFT